MIEAFPLNFVISLYPTYMIFPHKRTRIDLFCYILVCLAPRKCLAYFFAFICPIREFRVKVDDDLLELMNEGCIVVVVMEIMEEKCITLTA